MSYYLETRHSVSYVCVRNLSHKITHKAMSTNLILRSDIKKAITTDQILFGKVTAHLDVSIRYGLVLLEKDDPRFTQAAVLRLIKEHMRIPQETDLLIETADA